MNRKQFSAPRMATIVGAVLLIAASSTLQAADLQSAEKSGITITPGIPIHLPAGAPPPITRAVEDLQRDLLWVLGQRSPVVRDPADADGRPVISVAHDRAFKGGRNGRDTGEEAHGVLAADYKDPPQVVLHGSGTRGILYAIYSFSEQVLGIPPLWFYASYRPRPRDSIHLPAGFRVEHPAPHVRWRCWFPNDVDLLRPWRSRSSANFDVMYETMLRLKLNCLESHHADNRTYSSPHPINREVSHARRRGLAYTAHHVFPLGGSLAAWNSFWLQLRGRTAPELSIDAVHLLEEFWEWHVRLAATHELETIWTTGFRGARDRPFWRDVSGAPSTRRGRADTIRDMVNRQANLVAKVHASQKPPTRVILYDELTDFALDGALSITDLPVDIVTFVSARRDHYPPKGLERVQLSPNQRLGYYFNLQFSSTGSHLAQAEGPWKMAANFRAIERIFGTSLYLSVVNVGNVREHVMEASANARMMWQLDAFDVEDWLLDFSSTYFGWQHAAEIGSLYRRFYDAYWQPSAPSVPGVPRQFVFHDQRYARAMQALTRTLSAGVKDLNPLKDSHLDTAEKYYGVRVQDLGAATQVHALIDGTRSSAEKFERVLRDARGLHPQLPAQGAQFFHDNLIVQAEFMLEANNALQALAQAIISHDVPFERTRWIARALDTLRSMRATLRTSEHGPWHGWYDGDRRFGLNARIAEIEAVLAQSRATSPSLPTEWNEFSVGTRG